MRAILSIHVQPDNGGAVRGGTGQNHGYLALAATDPLGWTSCKAIQRGGFFLVLRRCSVQTTRCVVGGGR
jgi:hypothetical protein